MTTDETDPAMSMMARIQEPSVREALALLIGAAKAVGFTPIYRHSEVESVQFRDAGRRNPFSAIANRAHLLFYFRRPVLAADPGLWARAVDRFGEVEANGKQEYRLRLTTPDEVRGLIAWLGAAGIWSGEAARARGAPLPASAFAAVTPVHLLEAAQSLVTGFVDHPFIESTGYDVLFGPHRLSPKAIFGTAATSALGRPIGPSDFIGGEGTVCFRMLASAGYTIVRKGAPREDPPVPDLDRLWAEGEPRLIAHLCRERGDGIAAAKRTSFKSAQGHLFCEACGLDPVTHFGGEDGEACIEVHHRETAVADMEDGHLTCLDDLQCLCANCHRLVHHRLRAALARPDADAH